MSKGYLRIIVAVLLFAASLLLEIKQKAAFGWTFDPILAALLVLPLFLNLAEFLFFGSLVFLVLKTVFPWNGAEIALLVAFPVLAFVFQKIFPWQSWLEPFVLTALGLLVFYGFLNPAGFFNNISFLLPDIFVSMAYGWAICYFMGMFTRRGT